MSSTYPGTKDSFTNPSASDQLDSVTVPHATQHANLNDAMVAVQSTLGVNPQGGSADVATRLGTMVTSTMGADINANGYDIYSVDQLAVGTSTVTAKTVNVTRTASVTTGYVSLNVADALTWNSGSFLLYTALSVTPILTFNTAPLGVIAMAMNPTLAGSATGYAVVGIQSLCAPPASSALSKWTALQVGGGRAADTVLSVGIDLGVTQALAGTTVWAMQVGNYQSYHQGKFAVGGTTAPTWNLHMQGGNSATNGIGVDVSTTGPTAPSSNGGAVFSIYKGATNYYALLTFNDAGTTRYKYLQLNGTGTTWAQGTTLPT